MVKELLSVPISLMYKLDNTNSNTYKINLILIVECYFFIMNTRLLDLT